MLRGWDLAVSLREVEDESRANQVVNKRKGTPATRRWFTLGQILGQQLAGFVEQIESNEGQTSVAGIG
jgi:hypothetical protein